MPISISKSMKKWFLATILFVGIGCLALILTGAFLVAHPNPLKVFKDYGAPEDYGLVAETFHTKTGEAWLIRNPASLRVVLLCHGRSRNRSYLLPLAQALARRVNVAMFDFRSHGQHAFGTCSIGKKEARDVGEMLDALEARGFSDIVVYGASMGGAAAALELGEGRARPSVSGLILNGAFADLRQLLVKEVSGSPIIPGSLVPWIIDLGGAWAGFAPGDARPGDAIRKIRAPVLVLQARSDELLPASSGETLAGNAGGVSRLCMYEGTHDLAVSMPVQTMALGFVQTLNPECLDSIISDPGISDPGI